jgi:RHS repeat-associated protein
MKKILLIVSMIPVLVLGQSANENYTKTTTYKEAGATLPVTQITYYDGLGHPIQQIANAQSNTGKDIVTHIEYDAFGRQVKDYLPYANTTPSLNYNPNAGSETASFYSSPAYDNTLNPYSDKLLENSPLNRVLKQAAPGNAWALGSGHEIKLDYQTNTASEVKYFKATANWNAGTGLYDIYISDNGNYEKNQLYKTVTKDENWTSGNDNATQEFKNKEGQVVLKRTFNAGNAHDTFYVYDQYGNLTYVLPPAAEGATTNLDGLCYQYKYDYRNRLAAKKIPGKQWEYIVYDKLDKPVATGPAFSPWGDGSEGILITEYDVFGRVTQTAWKPMAMTETARGGWQNDITNGTNPFVLAEEDILTKNYYDNYTFPNAPTLPTTLPDSTYPIAQNVKGLATGSWVRVLTLPSETNGETSYTFYDDKYRPVQTHTTNYLGGFTQVDTNLDFAGKTNYTLTTHKRTDADEVITLQDLFTYSAQDRLLLHKQKIISSAMPEELIASNTYDELGQLTSKNVGGQDVSGSVGLQKVDYTYNIRGWLKGINDTASLNQGTTAPQDLFAFKLSYNDPTTATPLYNGNISETFWKTNSDNVLRKYNYTYDNLNRLLDATYSKPDNASAMNNYWENLSYDKNGNIITLKRNGDLDSDGMAPENMIDNLTFTYDLNNPNRLMKVIDETNNPQGFKDDSDGINDPVYDYLYDDNGNMIKDDNKGITGIAYNHLNLPTKIIFNDNESTKIEYIYNALGQKVSKQVTDQHDDGTGTGGETMRGASTARMVDTVTQTDYMQGGFQYKDTELQFFPTAEGYVRNDQGIFSHVYQYKDHLGNIRVSYQDIDKNGVLGNEEIIRWAGPLSNPYVDYVSPIIEESHYYPFGLKQEGYIYTEPTTNFFKFNGKELQIELGLNMYDYGARNYDAALGRWMNIDPLAEEFLPISPYVYAMSNPIFFIDPDGMEADNFFKSEFLNENGGHWSDKYKSENSESDKNSESEDNDEQPVNFFSRTAEGQEPFNAVFDEMNKSENYDEGDGKFSVFGHGSEVHIGDNKGKTGSKIYAKQFDKTMSKRSPAYKKKMENGESFTLTIYSCHSATGSESIAKKLSMAHKNATIVGFDGFVMYGEKNGKPAIIGISSVENRNDNKGFVVIYKDGTGVSMPYNTYLKQKK